MMPGVTADLVSQLHTQRLSICACACASYRIQILTAMSKPFNSNADSGKFSEAVPQRHQCYFCRTVNLIAYLAHA